MTILITLTFSALIVLLTWTSQGVDAFSFHPFYVGSASHLRGSDNEHKPKLVLIGGAPGTGKSTFGMSIALQEGILKCISTDTVRAVMRSFVSEEVSPALHRSSYAPAFDNDDPVRSWKETCTVLHSSVASLVEDAIERKVSLVVEGVHLIPSTKLTQKWQDAGGIALGCLLQVQDAETHKQLLQRRGYLTGNMDKENNKIAAYDRIRAIQDEMMRLADESGWMRIEQKTEPDPLEVVASRLWGIPSDAMVTPQQQMIFSSQTTTTTTTSNDSQNAPEPKEEEEEEQEQRLFLDYNNNDDETKKKNTKSNEIINGIESSSCSNTNGVAKSHLSP